MEKCFAMKEKGCGALVDDAKCAGCPFYKTRAQQEESIRVAFAHLRELPECEQVYYAEKYYRGKMPWADAIV